MLVGLEAEEGVRGIEALWLVFGAEWQEGEDGAVGGNGEAGEGVRQEERDGAEAGFAGDGVPLDQGGGGGEPGLEDAGI